MYLIYSMYILRLFFFFNDTATTEIYTLSLHDALPILSDEPGSSGGADLHAEPGRPVRPGVPAADLGVPVRSGVPFRPGVDRKSTRLNSSHSQISYAVFCLTKKYHLSSHD